VALGFYAGVVAVDIGLVDAMRANERSSRLAAEQRQLAERTELLFHELQHRVSNNIQMVGAMLSLQQRQVVDPIARMVLTDASTKLQLIGRIQRQLYSTTGEQVPLDIFLRDLMTDLLPPTANPHPAPDRGRSRHPPVARCGHSAGPHHGRRHRQRDGAWLCRPGIRTSSSP
jgi:hypothetical protein